MISQRSNGHTVSQLTGHNVRFTKYRYSVLFDDIKVRCRSILIQICDFEDVVILKGVVSTDHIQINYRSFQSLSDIVKKLKGRSLRKLQQEFTELILRSSLLPK